MTAGPDDPFQNGSRDTRPILSGTYLDDVVRLARLAVSRHSQSPQSGRAPIGAGDIVNQLVMRAGTVAPSTWRKEKRALAAFLALAADPSQKDRLVELLAARSGEHGHGQAIPDTDSRETGLAGLLDLCRTYTAGLETSCMAALDRLASITVDAAAMEAHHEAVRLAGVSSGHPDAVDPEAIETARHRLAGTEAARTGRKRKSDSFQPITAADMHRLRYAILAARIHAGRETDPSCLMDGSFDGRADLVAALLFEAGWHTGLRPVEWYQSTVVAGPRGHADAVEDWLPELAEAEMASGRFAAGNAVTETGDRDAMRRALIDHCLTVLFGDEAIRNGAILPGRPAAVAHSVGLVVRNAKTTAARTAAAGTEDHGEPGNRLPAIRLLDLSPLPYSVRRSIFYLTFLRTLPPEQRPSFERNLRGLVARASERAFPGRRRISLYDARHDFADRVRAVYSRAEAMALMGHTNASSMTHYGRKRRRQGSGGRGGGALPIPDAGLVALVRQHLAMKGLEDIPACGPSSHSAGETAAPEGS